MDKTTEFLTWALRLIKTIRDQEAELLEVYRVYEDFILIAAGAVSEDAKQWGRVLVNEFANGRATETVVIEELQKLAGVLYDQ